MPQSTSLPSFKDTLGDAWELFQKKVGKLILVTVGTFFIQILVMILIGLITVALFAVMGKLNILRPVVDVSQQVMVWPMVSTGIFAVLLALVYILAEATVLGLSFVYQLQYIDSTENKFKFSIKASLAYIPVLFLAYIIFFFLIVGGFFVFVLPVFVFGFFLMFVPHVIVFEKKSFLQAMNKSTQLVSQNFGGLLVRILTPVFIFIFIQAVVMGLVTQSPISIFMLQLPMTIFGALEGYFMLIYSYVLYKQTVRGYKQIKSSAFKWIVVVSLIGYIVLFSCIFGVIKVVKSSVGQSFFNTLKANSVSSLNQIQNQNTVAQGVLSDSSLNLVEAQKLGSETFALVNDKRIALGIKPLQNTDKLCAYAQHRLTVNEKLGSYDGGQGFVADLKDPRVGVMYFTSSTYLSEQAFAPLDKTTTSSQIVDYWINYAGINSNTKSGILDKQYDKGCLVNDTQLMFLIISKPLK